MSKKQWSQASQKRLHIVNFCSVWVLHCMVMAISGSTIKGAGREGILRKMLNICTRAIIIIFRKVSLNEIHFA